MAGRIKMSFHTRVLVSLLTMCGVLVGAFILFQYGREKQFKTEMLNAQLQIYNNCILDDLENGESIYSIVARTDMPVEGLRMTLVDEAGNVVYDNNDRTPFPSANHNNRPEIADARKTGMGHVVERWSESDETDYFYSATLGDDGMVMRSAVPYDHSLKTVLSADVTFLWVMLAITAVVCVGGYFVTRNISKSIMRLNNFAEKAEKGERIFDDDAFPHDELGSIASHIVRLYVQRDRQHKELVKQEREKVMMKKRLTDNINHELKTPTASILVCADLLRDHPELPEVKKDEFIGRIQANARRLNSLLSDVSALTRMDEGADAIAKEPVDVKELVEEVVDDERMRTDMAIEVEVPPLTVVGNRHLLESIFRNLIDNAIAYSGGTKIMVTADGDGNFVVKDNGTGIPEEHLSHIFERFYRIDKGRSREAGGTGLGLAIVKNAVTIHGGEIKAANDGGLRFDFNLPVS